MTLNHPRHRRQPLSIEISLLAFADGRLRELALWNADAGLGGAFADIESLASECAFRDCRHEAEPGCAVRDATESGTLAEDRLRSYRKLERELEYVAGKQDESLRFAGKNRWKAIAKKHRQRENVRAKYVREDSKDLLLGSPEVAG